MEGTDSCFIAEDVKFSFSTYNVGSGGGVNSKVLPSLLETSTGTKVNQKQKFLSGGLMLLLLTIMRMKLGFPMVNSVLQSQVSG